MARVSSFALILLFSCRLQLEFLAVAISPIKDFNYMNVAKSATNFLPKEEYDYIVIGGGTAGCPLAATLSQHHSVLVLERGDIPQANPSVLTLDGFLFDILVQQDNETTPFQKIRSEDGVESLRGRVLGGTSMINAGFYSRAEEDFVSKSGINWDSGLVEKAYEWVEETVVFRPRELGVWQSALREALLESGVVPDNGFSLDHSVGTKVSGSIFDESERRHGAAELLNKGNCDNLHIAVLATVEKIVFSTETSKPSAIGVIYTDSHGKTHEAQVRHKGEVILSAGAIGSPQILLLSGVGPSSYLSSQHIQTVHQNPNVGKFMADNPRSSVSLVLPNPIKPSAVQVVGIEPDYYIEGFSTIIQTPRPNTSNARVSEKVRGPLSHGSLWLSSPTDVKAAPRVRFNYLTHPTDLARCVRAARKLGEMLDTSAMGRFKHEDRSDGATRFVYNGPSLPDDRSDDSEMEDFCRSTVGSFHHYHGGCLVGKVVDGDFRVIGINGLRVVDGSTFNASPGTNPQATLMMLGRYIGQKILRERTRREAK